jgi:hypothetical protein
MRRLLTCIALAGAMAGLSGCDDKKTTAAAGTSLGTGPRVGGGAPPPPPPPPPPGAQ